MARSRVGGKRNFWRVLVRPGKCRLAPGLEDWRADSVRPLLTDGTPTCAPVEGNDSATTCIFPFEFPVCFGLLRVTP
jgi:hypothetical protein